MSVNVLGSPIVPVVVFRAGGSYGRVSVTVTTYSGTPAGMQGCIVPGCRGRVSICTPQNAGV